MRKGLSPLIGIVFLIAIVAATAFVFGEWAKPFAEKQTRVAENESERFHTCKDVWVRILDTSHSADEVNVTVMNSGRQTLSSVNVVVVGAGQVITQTEITDLTSSEHASVQLDTQGSTPERIVFIPKDCPQMTTERLLQ